MLRVGGGLFYDRTSARPLGSLAQYSQPAVTSVLLLDSVYSDAYVNAITTSGEPPNLYRFSPSIRTPYIGMYSASLEHQILKSATLTATYRGSVGVSLFTSLNRKSAAASLLHGPAELTLWCIPGG